MPLEYLLAGWEAHRDAFRGVYVDILGLHDSDVCFCLLIKFLNILLVNINHQQ
jgi:hypothetical protein